MNALAEIRRLMKGGDDNRDGAAVGHVDTLRRRVSWLAIPDYSPWLIGGRLAVVRVGKETAGQVNPQAEAREIHCRIR